MASIFDYVKKAKDYYDEYKDLIDLGGQAGKAYLDYKDQKRRNELDEQAYRDYMLEKESAGQEAQTAVDINLTPMEVTGVPTSKADVTSFQAVANGGIIGLKNGGAPNAGIAALRKKAPGVVKRMGYNEGSGKNGVMQIIDKIRNNNYKRQLGETDQGDLNERTTVIETNNAFKEPFRAIAEPGESKNRSILNALISDGMEGMEEKMDEASKDKMILSLIKEMRETGEMEKDEYNMYMESYLTSEMQKGGIAGLRNGGRPGYMMGEGPVMDGTVKIEDAVKMAGYEPGVPTTGDLYDMNNPDYKGINPKIIREFIDEGIPLGYTSPEEYFDDFYGPFAKKNKETIMAKKGGIADLRKKYAIGSDPDEYDPYEDMSVKEILIEEGYPTANEAEFEEEFGTLGSKNKTDNTMKMAYNSGTAYSNNEGVHGIERAYRIWQILPDDIQGGYGGFQDFFETSDWHGVKMKKGGRVKYANGSDGILDLGGREKDYRFNGGFVPIGEYEKKDDVPARLSKNEFVFTADAVRAAGGGSINKGAQKMYNTMKTLEAQPTAKRMTA